METLAKIQIQEQASVKLKRLIQIADIKIMSRKKLKPTNNSSNNKHLKSQAKKNNAP